jgi:hypothetical protein
MTNMSAKTTRRLAQIRWLLAFFMAGLVVSGLSAVPLPAEADALVRLTRTDDLVATRTAQDPSAAVPWLVRARNALRDTSERHPVMFYGTDWLAFGHLVIAISFIGAWRDPVRNGWLFDFGLIACALVIPWALVFGHVRGIPPGWRAIDCSFGIVGAVPLLICRKLLHDLENKSVDGKNGGPAALAA